MCDTTASVVRGGGTSGPGCGNALQARCGAAFQIADPKDVLRLADATGRPPPNHGIVALLTADAWLTVRLRHTSTRAVVTRPGRNATCAANNPRLSPRRLADKVAWTPTFCTEPGPNGVPPGSSGSPFSPDTSGESWVNFPRTFLCEPLNSDVTAGVRSW
jgi:hypothetical protein